MKYEEASRLLIEAIPELKSQYDAELEWWKDETPGPHIIFGDVLLPFVTKLIEVGESERLVRRIFAFIERMANSEDSRVRDLVGVSICEPLIDHRQILERARSFMGPKTRGIME